MKNLCFHLNRKLWVTMAMLLTLALPSLAQKITVTGHVADELGEDLIGATIMEKGTTNGVSADLDGNFTINVPANATLMVSYVGYDPMDVPVNGQTHLNIVMQQNHTVLAETVVIGYGTVKKSDATGSVAVIKPDEIEAGISTSAQDLLVGQSPGVVVTPNGGNPSGGATIRIRGGASLNASNDPLIVIDGVPQTNQSQGSGLSAMTMINPNDIESMTILKDASATAIYGSRASNGVIIITTKKGHKGKLRVNVAANFAVNTARKTLNVMDGNQFADVVRQYLPETSVAKLGYNGTFYNTDWQKQILRTTFSQDYAVSVSGAAGNVPYRVNVGYTNNQGIMKTSSLDRATAGISINPKFFDDKLQITANVNGTYARQNNADTGAISEALGFDPTKPVYAQIPLSGNTGLDLYNGYFNWTMLGESMQNTSTNPVQLIGDVDSFNKTLSSTGNLQIDYALHFLPELHLNLNLGYQFSKNDGRSETAANSFQNWKNTNLLTNQAAGAATLNKWNQIQQNTLLDFYINYKKDFEAIKSALDVMVGYSWQRFKYWGSEQLYVNSLGFVGTDGAPKDVNSLNGGDYFVNWSNHDAIGEAVNYSNMNRWGFPSQLISFFGRLNYSFDDTLLVTFTLRDDASSRFSKKNRWGLFPSVALGWKINNMGELRDVAWLDEWKLRLGWGQTGQQDLGDSFLYLPIYTNSSSNWFQYPSYVPGGTYPGMGWTTPLYPQSYNNNIKWETTTTWNVGVDFGIFNNRLNIAADWYMRKTKDLIANVAVKGSNTSDMMIRNVGSLENYGVEFTISAKPVVTENFLWNTGINIAWNHNEITSLNDGELIANKSRDIPGGGIGGDLQWFAEGYPVNSFRVYQQVYDNNGNPVEGQYVDQNADGIIDDNDLIFYHSPEPKWTLSWNNTFNFHNWDIGFMLRANLGNWVYNAPRRTRTNTSTIDAYGLHNLLADEFLFHTTPTKAMVLSDYWIENASFLRCDNITIGYTWPNLIDGNLRLRIYGAVQNPFVITKYKGVDPEVFDGRDSNVYPRPITCTVGLVATF